VTHYYLAGGYSTPERLDIPHSIIKHRIYFHETDDINSNVIDTLEFILDHTRYPMNIYPFRPTNESSSESYYDIRIKLHLDTDPNGHTFNVADNQNWYNGGTSINGTLDYFPLQPDIYGIPYFYPDDLSVDFFNNNIQPPPFALFYSEAFCGNEDLGVQHEYKVDRFIDLSVINPEEKIIYNPSVVSIEYDLLLPEGYKFLTLPDQGIFPDRHDLETNYPYQFYNSFKEIPYQYGHQNIVFSEYHIESGATLTIGPCVTINDAIIVIKPGGKLRYDPDKTYGNFDLDNNGGAIEFMHYYDTECEEECIQPFTYNARDIIIESDVFWTKSYLDNTYGTTNGNMGISGNLTISSGNKLEILHGVMVRFHDDSKIIVEPGAELIIRGANLTSACSALWRGITVEGNWALVQVPANQGYVQIFDDAIIENAETAIYSMHGGIIDAFSCSFKNNIYDIIIDPYHQPQGFADINNCHFSNCDFITDNQLVEIDKFSIAHVKLYDVSGVDFKYCRFLNSRQGAMLGEPGPLYANLRGTGILSNDADFKVLPGCSSFQYGVPCSNPLKSTFEGLYYAIKASSSAGTESVTIQQCDFTDNYRGVLLENMFSPTVFSNNFYANYTGEGTSLYQQQPPPYGNSTYSMYLNQCAQGFRIEDNEFHDGDAGLFIFDSEDMANQVFYNRFYDIDDHDGATALTALGNNSNWDGTPFSGYDGLQFICNTFNTSKYNMSVLGNTTIARSQGLYNKPAGNNLDHYYCAPNSENDFFIDDISPINNYIYYCKDNAHSQFLDCHSDQINTYTINPSNPCAFSLNPVSPILQLQTDLTGLQITINNKQSELSSLIDGGDTQSMLQLVENMAPNNFNQSCNALLNVSPCVSDTVLTSFMNIDINGHADRKRDVLLANSPLPENALDELE
ncbi:MAG: hypothetical protein ABIJ97_15550, partial [Bacteroidota bacterium]